MLNYISVNLKHNWLPDLSTFHVSLIIRSAPSISRQKYCLQTGRKFAPVLAIQDKFVIHRPKQHSVTFCPVSNSIQRHSALSQTASVTFCPVSNSNSIQWHSAQSRTALSGTLPSPKILIAVAIFFCSFTDNVDAKRIFAQKNGPQPT